MFTSKYVIFCIIFVNLSYSDENLFQKEWEQYKVTFGKFYDSQEEGYRYSTFVNNFKTIQENHKKFENGEVMYKLGLNKFSDLSWEQFNSGNEIHFINKRKNPARNHFDYRDDDIPEAIDWRELGAVTEVKDERVFYEGYSWAFSVAGAYEAQVFQTIKTLVPLSAQQLIDCADPNNTKDYFVGMLDFAYDYVSGSTGILTEAEYPYTGTIGPCTKNESGISSGLYVDLGDEWDLIEAVGTEGTVTAVIDASRLLNYESGIIDNTLCSNEEENLNHAVLIVGYGVENEVKYWIGKNSWGTNWGENGYFRLKQFDNNTCGVGSSAAYPWVAH